MGGVPMIRYRVPASAAALPPTLSMHVGDNVLQMPSADVTADLAMLVGWARENDVDLTGLEVGPPSLEDAYLALDPRGRAEPCLRSHCECRPAWSGIDPGQPAPLPADPAGP